MGIMDTIMGSSPELKFDTSHEQKKVGKPVQNMLRDLFRLINEGENPFYNPMDPTDPSQFLPTEEAMQSLDPSISAGMWHPVNQAGQQMSEMMAGRGQMGGSQSVALGQLYGQAAPQIGLNLANMLSGAQRFSHQANVGQRAMDFQEQTYPFNLGAGLFPSTLPNPVVQPGSPGLLGAATQIAAPFAMGAGMGWGGGGFQNPFSGMLGGGQSGQGGFASLGGGTNFAGANMGAPWMYNPTFQAR